MKFRMAENSLFAVLLRSPFWVSFAIGVAFVGAAQALLPEDYRTVGSLGALPFFVIGCIALWRQVRAPSAAESQAILQAVSAMSWAQFEPLLRQAYARDGWQVQPAGGGADLRLERPDRTVLVAARRWKAARQGEEALQPLQAAMRREHAGGVCIALGDLSAQALRAAKGAGIELVGAEGLVRLLRGLVPVKK